MALEEFPIYLFDYDGDCWWCAAEADTGEHKFKRTDIRRQFGSGSYQGKRALVMTRGGRPDQVFSGSRSDILKFPNSMCQPCNGPRSQPFDSAYDEFMAFVDANDQRIRRACAIELADIYGPDWPDRRHALLRYYVKHISCRLAELGVLVPAAFLAYLNAGATPGCLAITMDLREDIAAMSDGMVERDGYFGALWTGDVEAYADPSTGHIVRATSCLGYRWLQVSWEYDIQLEAFGDPCATGAVRLTPFSMVDLSRLGQMFAEVDRFRQPTDSSVDSAA